MQRHFETENLQQMHSNNKNIFIVIPVHNRKYFTRECLLSLRKQSFQNFKVIVVDDGSTDGTGEMIKEEFSDVIILEGDGNLWWTGATNMGVECALDNGADYIMLLNNDTVANEEFIDTMVFWAKKKPRALLGAFALDARTKKPIYGGEIINWKAANSTFFLDILNPKERHGLHEVTHFPGRGLLIPSEVFTRIGLFDARHFPQAVADYDFTHRAKKAGFKIYCNYDAIIYTFPNESSNIKLRQQKSLKNYYNHLFSIRGGGNLIYFYKYAVKNCPKRYIIPFLFLGIFKRIFGYPKHWFLDYFRQ